MAVDDKTKADEKARQDKDEADKAALVAARARGDKQDEAAALLGARAVADAVTRVANAAVDQAGASARAEAMPELVVRGTPGGTFEAKGKGFSSSGSIFFNGKKQETYEWGDTYIRGKLDADVTNCQVTVPVDEKKTLTGYFKAI